PSWADGASVRVGQQPAETATPGTFHRVDQEWGEETNLRIEFPMALRSNTGHAGLLSIYRGPLLFGLRMGEHWEHIGGEIPHADWEVYPTTPWNYALEVDPTNLTASLEVEEMAVSDVPFDPA